MIFTSRSKVESYLYCPRRRWWEYEANGGVGYEEKVFNPALLVGGQVHAGLALLVQGSPADDAVIDALRGFDLACEQRGLNGDALECRALIEACIRVFAKIKLPKILEEYEIIDVEREEVTPLSSGVTQQARTDAVVRRKADGLVFVVNWKTCSQADERWYKGWETDLQIATEMLAVETRLKAEARTKGVDPDTVKVDGVMVEGIIKGSYKKLYDEDGRECGKELNNPLIYGYKSPANPPFESSTYAAEYQWRCTEPHIAKGRVKTWHCQGNKTHKRDGWERIKVWEEGFIGEGGEPIPEDRRIDYWINQVVPQATLEAQFASVPGLTRDDLVRGAVRKQIVGIERDIDFKRLRVLNEESDLDSEFGQSTRGCIWPTQCPCYHLCWTSEVANDPIGSGLYVDRVSNHPIMKEEE